MEHCFAVSVCGKQVGKVMVQQQGLYYHFHCRCNISGDIIYRLIINCGNHQENLGILVPQESSFVLDKKIPVKKIGEGKMSFRLTSTQEHLTGTFIPIRPEEPFAYIARIKESFLILKDGQPGICIDKMQEC